MGAPHLAKMRRFAYDLGVTFKSDPALEVLTRLPGWSPTSESRRHIRRRDTGAG
jgi:hypothetical protein